jgi:hypothetical protein
MMDEIPLATQVTLYKGQMLLLVLAVFEGVMLHDFILCLPAEVTHIFYPEILALCKGKGRGRAAIPTLL